MTIAQQINSSPEIVQNRLLAAIELGQSRWSVANKVSNALNLRDQHGNLQVRSTYEVLNHRWPNEMNLLKTGREAAEALASRVAESHQPLSQFFLPVNEYKSVQLVQVNSSELRTLYKRVQLENPDATELACRPLQYLIMVNDSCAGVIGFDAPNIHSFQREQFIGWGEKRTELLEDNIVRMNTFFLRSNVSKQAVVPSILKVLPVQFEIDYREKYGFAPVIFETYSITPQLEPYFVKSNWQYIGPRERKHRKPFSCFLFTTAEDIWTALGVDPNDGMGPLGNGGLSPEEWVEQELQYLDLGDERRNRVIIEILKRLVKSPNSSLLEALEGDPKLARRLYYHLAKMEEKIKRDPDYLKKLALANFFTLIRRVRALPTCLFISDGVRANYDTLIKCMGMGAIGAVGSGDNLTTILGLYFQQLLCTDENGKTVGLAGIDFRAFPLRKKGVEVSDDEKRTYLWQLEFQQTALIKKYCPNTQCIYLADREADMMPLFFMMALYDYVDFVVRSHWDRVDARTNQKIQAKVAKEKPLGTHTFTQERQSERKNKEKRSKRYVTLTIRATPVSIRLEGTEEEFEGIERRFVNATLIHAYEENPPEGENPVSWYLLTSLKVETLEDAIHCIHLYKERWRIEDENRVVKTTYKLEELQNHSAVRIAILAHLLFLASTRITALNMLSRTQPEEPVSTCANELEEHVVNLVAEDMGETEVENVGDYVRIVAKLGGYLGRKGDSHPGNEVVGKGVKVFNCIVKGSSLVLKTTHDFIMSCESLEEVRLYIQNKILMLGGLPGP